MAKNAIVGQSGGPTSVINASLAGVYESCKRRGAGKVYGMLHGVAGLLERRTCVLDDKLKTALDIELLKRTPSSYLGSCRYKLPDWHTAEGERVYIRLFEILKELDIGYFFYIGGNDSMDTIGKLADYGAHIGSGIRFMGVPKTIDNDLPITDHCPGFGSAAKYIATTLMEVAADAEVYPMKSVVIAEIMGRNAGWLTAAASLTRELGGSYAPQLIYLPEAVFDPEQFVEDVRRELDKRDTVVIAVSEGVRLADGSYAAESMQSGQVDAFGHKYLAGVGKYLERLTADRIGCKVRSLELSVMQRAAAHLQSATDLEEAVRAGEKAVEAMLRGDTRIMIAYRRISDAPYRIAYETAPLGEVANVEHKIPREWINEAGNDVREELVRYLAPLIQGEVSVPMKNGVPMHFSFDKTRLAD